MTRAVFKLDWATRFDGWPEAIPRPRPRGPKALGKRYEAAVAKQLPNAMHGQWWQFQDFHGLGLCQTDFVLEGKVWVAILECKHTWTPEGMDQLCQLYIPVVERALRTRVLGIQICKNLSPVVQGLVYTDFRAAIESAKKGRVVTMHWGGYTPLVGHQHRLRTQDRTQDRSVQWPIAQPQPAPTSPPAKPPERQASARP